MTDRLKMTIFVCIWIFIGIIYLFGFEYGGLFVLFACIVAIFNLDWLMNENDK